METKIRIFELAKELSVDSRRVMEVLQTLNVEVKNHMSTVDQETAEKVTEAVKRTPAKKTGAAAAKDAAQAAKAAAEASRLAREANPAKTSLLEDFFGAGARPRPNAGDVKRDVRTRGERPRPTLNAERPAAELPPRPATERPRPAAAERPSVAERPRTERPATGRVAAERPAAEAPARPAAERKAPRAEAAAERPEPAAAETERPEAKAVPEAAQARVARQEEPPVEASAEPAAEAGAPEHEAAPNGDTERTAAEGPARTLPSGPSRAVPAGPGAGRGVGMPRQAGPAAGPSRPLPAGPGGDRGAIERGPRPAGMPGPSGLSGIGLPSRPVPGASAAGPRGGGGAIGLPRPAGAGGLDRGPRPPGPRPVGPGGPRNFGPRRGGGGLAIPKVDPKVAEAAKPADGKTRIGQGGDRKKGDAFTKREMAASRPSEEKLFGRRPHHRSSVVERRSLKPITIEGPMTVKDLAHEMGVTAAEVIKKLLTGFGIMATINQELDTDTCVLVGGEFGIEVSVNERRNVVEEYDQVLDADEAAEARQPRHPVVTIMGHVDHGKTSLLDAVREAKVAAGEAGGITQHIGAYEVELNGRKITFLDTPGHEAFTAMRARGANVTDIAVLVVAADDSVMPQTIESINHAKAANVPVLVAINKVDKPDAKPDKVKQDLTAHGLVAEEWGGETIMVPVSAKQMTNLDLLLENILVLADVLDLKANSHKEARGTILEAELDKARGPVATVLVQAGTLNNGDVFVAGSAWGRVRAMFDHRGRKLKTAGPSTPVRILGFQSVPAAGDVFRVAPDEKTAKEVAEKRQNQAQAERQTTKAMSLDDFMSKVKEGEIKDLNLIIKGDVQGSVEALRGQLEKLRNEEVQVKIVHGGVGAISESDVMLATTSNSILIGFNVRPDDRAARAAAEQGIDIRTYDVIYNVVDDMKAALTGMLAPKIEESILGRAEVREIFKVPKVGMAAGCMIVSGKVTRNAKIRLIRDGVVVYSGEINALRRFKEEVKEVLEGFECGITLEKFQDFKPGDIIEAFEMKEVKPV